MEIWPAKGEGWLLLCCHYVGLLMETKRKKGNNEGERKEGVIYKGNKIIIMLLT